MSDPMFVATSQGGANVNPASAASGESAQSQSSELAYKSQLSKAFLDSPDALAKLAKAGGKLDNLADAYIKARDELDSKNGQTAIPAKDAPQEAWETFYKQLGRPEKPEDYAFARDKFKDLPSMPEIDKFTQETFHKAGLSKAQSDMIFEANASKATELMAAQKAQKDAQIAEGKKQLEQMWGREYQAKTLDLQASVKTFMGEGIAKEFFNSPLANNAVFLDRLASLNKYMKDAPFRGGQPSSGAQGRSAASVIFSKS